MDGFGSPKAPEVMTPTFDQFILPFEIIYFSLDKKFFDFKGDAVHVVARLKVAEAFLNFFS
jgi:hypothetical protein